jgi:hypothetical protein
MATIKLKDLLAGQERLAQRENMPLDQSQDKMQKLVDAITQKSSPSISLNSNQKIFEDFVKQTQKREELLKDATSEQIVIFKHLEDTIKKLKDASHADSVNLRKTLETLARNLRATPANAARSSMLKTLTAPAVSAAKTSPNAPVLAPTDYKLFEDSASVGDTDDSRASMGEAEAKQQDSLGLLDLLKAGLLGRTLKGTLTPNKGNPKSGKKGSPSISTAESKSARAKGGITKDAQGRWRNAAGQYVKKPGLVTQAAEKVKGPLKALGKVASKIPFIAPLVTGVMAGFDEYEQSGNIMKAATVGTSSAIAGEIGAAAGAAAGFAVGGPVGAFVGGAAGGVLGSEAGKTLGSAGYDIATTPALSAKSASVIRDMSMKNQDIADAKDSAPVIINNTTAAPSQVMPHQTYIPRGDVRPNESALERYIDRSFAR